MKLFVFYIGGDAPGSIIELHDIRFVAAEKVEDCYDTLIAQWWGIKESLHLDCWGVLDHADGYDIAFKAEPYNGKEKLYFVNLGGYDPTDFSELHKNVFVVAESESKAKVRALKQILDWKSHHKDNQMDIEKALRVDQLLKKNALSIHLTKTDVEKPFKFTCKYLPIRKKT